MSPVWQKFSNHYDINNILRKSAIYNPGLTGSAVRRCSAKLLVCSKVFLKASQISLENTCAGYNMYVKIWLYAFCPHLNLEKSLVLFSNEICRIFIRKTFLLEYFWGSASRFICNILKSNKYMKVSFIIYFF